MDEPVVEKAEPELDESLTTAVRQGSRPRHRRWILPVLLLLAGVVGFLLFQRQEKGKAATAKPSTQQAAVSITTALAEKGNIGVYVNALGSVTPLNTVTVK